MPLYEYKCSSCGHQQEFLQKWSDTPLTVCTACGKETFSKMLTAAGFQLKGSGWYATDFKGSGAKPAAKAADKAADKPAEKSGGDAAKPDSGTSAASESKKDTSAPSTGSAASS